MDPYSNTDSRKLLSTDSIWIRIHITGCIMLTCVLCTEVDLEEVGELTPLEIMEANVILDTSTPHPITTQVRVHPSVTLNTNLIKYLVYILMNSLVLINIVLIYVLNFPGQFSVSNELVISYP